MSRSRRLESVVQYRAEPARSRDRHLLGVKPTPDEGPHVRFDEHAY
jgi:hypothetical protein